MAYLKESKYLSYLLRHHPEGAGLDMDKEGWVDVSQLIHNTGVRFTMKMLREIVASDKKGRYSFNEDRTKIRANQGHSAGVCDISFKKADHVEGGVLYHGTTVRAADKIAREGIKPMGRQYVHLSGDRKTAERVTMRRKDRIVVLQVDAEGMLEDGVPLYLADNGVWLADYVDPKYIIHEPYIKEVHLIRLNRYNPNFGDGRFCVCGHTYKRHFDARDEMDPVCGCEDCDCNEFLEKR